MHRRWQFGIGSTATVVLTGVSGALINELHGGWGWIVAAAAVVLMAALLTGWLALRTGDAETAQHLSNGAVEARRDIHGAVRTETVGPSVERSSHGPCDSLGPGAVKAGRDIRGEVTTRTENYPPHTS